MFNLFLATEQNPPSPSSDYWYQPLSGANASGIDVTPNVALTYGTVWACVRVLTGAGGHLPLNLRERNGRTTTIRDDHPVHRLLHWLPNREQTSMSFRAFGLAQQINHGNFFAEIVRAADGTPAELWPIHHSRVQMHRPTGQMARALEVPDNAIMWEVRNSGRPSTWIADNDMLHVRSMVLCDDGVCGKGVIQQAREAIGHGLATQRQGAAFMKNSARPGIVIAGGKFRTAEDREAFRRTWMSVHGGSENNALPALVPEGATVDKLSFAPDESQFLETLQHNVEEICRWYGVPPHMVQHLLRATYSNIEHQGIDFVVYSLIPWLVMWEQEIWRKLLNDNEKQTMYAKHEAQGLLRGDSASRSSFYQAMWGMGAFSINDIREKEDMNPVPDGDEHFIQSGYVTLNRAAHPEIPEPEPVDTPTDNEPVRRAVRLMVDETYERMLNKEITALSRMANKGRQEVEAWIGDFYASHSPVLAQALARPIEASIAICDSAANADVIASTHCHRSTKQLKELIASCSDWAAFGPQLQKMIAQWRDRKCPI